MAKTWFLIFFIRCPDCGFFFLRLLTPAGSEWVHEAFLGSIWGALVVGGQSARSVLLFTRTRVRAFFH
jgi:hypothetical protein